MASRARGEGSIPFEGTTVKFKFGNYEMSELEDSLPRGQFLADFIDIEGGDVRRVKNSLVTRVGWILMRQAKPERFGGGADGGFKAFCRWFDEQVNQDKLAAEFTAAFMSGMTVTSEKKNPPAVGGASTTTTPPSSTSPVVDGSPGIGSSQPPQEQG